MEQDEVARTMLIIAQPGQGLVVINISIIILITLIILMGAAGWEQVDQNYNSIIQKNPPQNAERNATRTRDNDNEGYWKEDENKLIGRVPEKKCVQFKEDKDLCEVFFYSFTCDKCSFSTGRQAEVEQHHQWEHSLEVQGCLWGDLLGGVVGLGYIIFMLQQMLS
jgi:hypothetical protein